MLFGWIFCLSIVGGSKIRRLGLGDLLAMSFSKTGPRSFRAVAGVSRLLRVTVPLYERLCAF